MRTSGGRKKIKKQRRQRRTLRFGMLILCVFVLTLMVILPGEARKTARERELCDQANTAYLDAQAENSRLTRLLAESNTSDFVERVARRDYGYCVFGETIYVVSNLDELLEAMPFETASAETGEF